MWIPCIPRLELWPHSHKEPTLPHSADGFSNHLMSCAQHLDEERGVRCCTRAGGVVFFCYGVAHATHQNLSDRPRAGVAYHFLAANEANMGSFHVRAAAALFAAVFPSLKEVLQVKDQFGNGWPSRLLSGEACDGGLARWGADLRGTWQDEVGAALAGSGLEPTEAFIENQERSHRRIDEALLREVAQAAESSKL